MNPGDGVDRILYPAVAALSAGNDIIAGTGIQHYCVYLLFCSRPVFALCIKKGFIISICGSMRIFRCFILFCNRLKNTFSWKKIIIVFSVLGYGSGFGYFSLNYRIQNLSGCNMYGWIRLNPDPQLYKLGNN